MPLLLGCLALVFPRVAVFLVWFFGGDYLITAVGNVVWLLLGFLFMPLTLLAFAFATHSMAPAGAVPDLGWVLIVLAGLLDLGLVGSGPAARKRRSRLRD
jgi:hypothetical protein